MAEFLCFFAGLLLGSCITLIFLCCVQINRSNEYERTIRRLREELKTKE